MVIICGSEDTGNSKIVAFLEKYRRPPLPLMSDRSGFVTVPSREAKSN